MSTTNQSKIVPKKVLVTGASGLLGVAAIEKFLAAGWEVVGVSRRKPQLPSGRDVDFLSVDLRDEGKARAALPERCRQMAPLASTYSMPSSSFGSTAETSSGSTSQRTRRQNGLHVK